MFAFLVLCFGLLTVQSLTHMNQQLLIMEMFLITMLSRVFYRKRYDELEFSTEADQETNDNTENTKVSLNGRAMEDGALNI